MYYSVIGFICALQALSGFYIYFSVGHQCKDKCVLSSPVNIQPILGVNKTFDIPDDDFPAFLKGQPLYRYFSCSRLPLMKTKYWTIATMKRMLPGVTDDEIKENGLVPGVAEGEVNLITGKKGLDPNFEDPATLAAEGSSIVSLLALEGFLCGERNKKEILGALAFEGLRVVLSCSAVAVPAWGCTSSLISMLTWIFSSLYFFY